MPPLIDAVVDLFRLTDSIAVVADGGSTLGAGIAAALAEAGCDVVVVGPRLPALEQSAAGIRDRGRECLIVHTDTTEDSHCEALVAAAVRRFGRIDIVVNVASTGHVAPADREWADDFRSVIDHNLVSAYLVSRACARAMPPGSSIVNVASMLALTAAVLPQSACAASSAGLIGLTRDLSQQWCRALGIRVNAIAAGLVAETLIPEMAAVAEQFAAMSTIGRLATQREIDACVVFLCSPAASYITGSTLAVDGGTTGH